MNNDIIEKQNTGIIQRAGTVERTPEDKVRDIWDDIFRAKTRNGEMLLFDDYRISLGGADNGWGTKVFFKTMTDLGLLERCDKEKHRSVGTYCPSVQAMQKYPQYFYYDTKTNVWGFNHKEIASFDEVILPIITSKGLIVRNQLKEAARRRKLAREYEKRVLKNDEFNLFD